MKLHPWDISDGNCRASVSSPVPLAPISKTVSSTVFFSLSASPLQTPLLSICSLGWETRHPSLLETGVVRLRGQAVNKPCRLVPVF